MLLRIMLFLLVMVPVVATPAMAITFETLTNPTGSLGSFDLTYDGSIAAANFGGQVYLLDPAGNFTLISTVPGGSGAGISGDGSTIVVDGRDSEGFEVAMIMKESEGWVANIIPVPAGVEPCDGFKSAAYKVNGDGSKVTGLLWDGCAAKAFLYTEATGMQDLGPTRGSVISQDGSVIGGFNRSHRRPAYWPIEGNIGGSSVLLHHEEDQGEVYDITTNGQVMVGTGLPYGYDPILTGYNAFRYEMGDTNFTLLGTLSGNPNDISKATKIADNGMIVGVSGPTSVSVTTFVWTPEIGMTSLLQYLTDAGVDVPSSYRFTWVKSLSKDGSIMIGEYTDLYGGWGYYRVDFGKTSSAGDVVRHKAQLTDVSPNPFNPMTTVSFSLDKRQHARVTVYDVAGRKVSVMADREFEAGQHQVVWRGKDQSGREMPSGSYIIHLESAEDSDSRTISLVR